MMQPQAGVPLNVVSRFVSARDPEGRASGALIRERRRMWPILRIRAWACAIRPPRAEDAWGGTQLVDARHRLSRRDDRRDRAIRWAARSEGIASGSASAPSWVRQPAANTR